MGHAAKGYCPMYHGRTMAARPRPRLSMDCGSSKLSDCPCSAYPGSGELTAFDLFCQCAPQRSSIKKAALSLLHLTFSALSTLHAPTPGTAARRHCRRRRRPDSQTAGQPDTGTAARPPRGPQLPSKYPNPPLRLRSSQQPAPPTTKSAPGSSADRPQCKR